MTIAVDLGRKATKQTNKQKSNLAHAVTFPPNYVDLYEQKPKAIKSFGIRI